jgi:hypothetical protein
MVQPQRSTPLTISIIYIFRLTLEMLVKRFAMANLLGELNPMSRLDERLQVQHRTGALL